MALSSVAKIRLTGGINESDAYFQFRVADDTALVSLITKKWNIAEAWLKKHSPTYYNGSASADTDIDLLFEGAEECLTMHYLTMPLKARKVYGTHAPYDSEGSERYQELIDVEWVEQVNGLIGSYLEEDSALGEDAPFALPQMGATGVITTDQYQTITEELDDVLEEAEGRMPALREGDLE